jgi:hypothetical protein
MAKRKLKKVKSKRGNFPRNPNRSLKKVAKDDVFLDEDSKVIVDDAYVSHPGDDIVRDVVHDLPGFQDWARESRGNGLTFGDY